MFFRGRQPEVSVWRRFRTNADGFTFRQEGDHYTAHAVANAERMVDLFHNLAEYLPPAVDVALEDVRTGRSWRGESAPLPDVRETIARLKMPLATYGGVEFAIYSSEDQLTLTPNLELYIYSRSDKWLYLLEGRGLEEQSRVSPKSWKINRQAFPAAPDLVNAVATAAERLALQRV